MRILHKNLIYDTKKIKTIFDLDENNPLDSVKRTPRYNASGSIFTLNASLEWANDGFSNRIFGKPEAGPKEKDEKVKGYIARTDNHHYVILLITTIKNQDGEEVEIKKDIIRYFENKADVVDYLSERFGYDDAYDEKLLSLFKDMGVKIEDA